MFTFSLLENDNRSCKVSKLSFDSDIVILADPSWDGVNHQDIDFMEQHLKNVDIIILSHGTPEFTSGFILLCIKFPRIMENIKVYSTVPVNQLGRISTVEFYRLHGILGPLQNAILEVIEIDEWFDKVIQLKFFQTISLFDNKLILTPYNAGHTLGGTFWLITKKLEKVIYAPAWNHSKDSFLNAASFLAGMGGTPLAQLIRPTVLITNTDLGSSMSHKRRTEKFLQLVDATLANGGSVLLPTSLLGRFLEILHLIDQHLQSAPIPVLFLSYSGTKALSYASNLLEWMSSLLIKEWEDSQTQGGTTMGSTNKNNIPFDPSKVDLLSDASELVQLTGPKIVFCTGLDFKIGDMSTEALQYLCNDQRTTIILTEKSKFHNNLSDELYQDWYNLAKLRSGLAEDGIAVPLERTLKLNNYFREEPLAGQELKDFKDKVNTKRKENLLAKVRSKRNKNLLNADNFGDSSDDDDEEDDEEDDEDEEQDGEGDRKGRGIKVEIDEKKLESVAAAAAAAAATSTTVTGNTNEIDASADAVDSLLSDKIKETLATNKPLDIRITHKLRPRQAMFPFFPTTHKQKFDDYGEVIDIKMYQKNEEPTQKKLVIDRKRHYNNNHNEGEKKDAVPKITPQESLNNEVLQKYLDTLFAPKKRVVPYNSTKELRVRCGLSFVDLSGLVDLRSLSLIVSLIKPYNLLLLPDETSAEDSETNQLSTVKKMFVQQQSNKQEQQFKKNVVNSARYMSLTNIRSGLYGGVSSSNSNKMNIEVPEPNKTIRIGYDDDSVGGIGLTNFEIKLDDAIFENLTWQNIDGSYKVAQVYGALEIANPKHEGETEEGEGDKKRLKTLNDYMNSSTQFTLKHLLKKDFLQQQQNFFQSITDNSSDNNGTKQLTEANNTAVNPKLAIGNVRLTELKKKLLAKNLNVEFKSEGTLVVNDMLAIRKVTYGSGEGDDDTGDIIIDGLMGPLYYEVKDCIREMLAYV